MGFTARIERKQRRLHVVFKGDTPGHPFRGNQYTSGEAAGGAGKQGDPTLSHAMPSWEDLKYMTTVPGPKGSNPATWKADPLTGRSYIIKPSTEDKAQNEIAAGVVYRHAGVRFPNTAIVHDQGGKPHVVSEKVEGLSQHSASEWKAHPEWQQAAAKHFGTDALLSHWDVHGLESDNTLIDKSGQPVRIESGGAMAFRAMGQPKPSFATGQKWVEPETMRTSDQGKVMYGKMSDAEAADSLERAGQIDLDKVREAWKQAGVSDANAKKWGDVLAERQVQIPSLVAKLRGTKRYPLEVVWPTDTKGDSLGHPFHGVVERVYLLADRDPRQTETILSTAPPNRQSAVDEMAATGDAGRAYLSALDVLRPRRPGLIVGTRQRQDGPTTALYE